MIAITNHHLWVSVVGWGRYNLHRPYDIPWLFHGYIYIIYIYIYYIIYIYILYIYTHTEQSLFFIYMESHHKAGTIPDRAGVRSDKSSGKWPFIMDLPMKHGRCFLSVMFYANVFFSQGVNPIFFFMAQIRRGCHGCEITRGRGITIDPWMASDDGPFFSPKNMVTHSYHC